MTIDRVALAGRVPGRREMQILQMLAEGHRMAAIAAQLHVSVATAKTFALILYAKIGAHTSAQAVSIGYQRGYLPLSPDLFGDLELIRSARELGCRIAVVRAAGDTGGEG